MSKLREIRTRREDDMQFAETRLNEMIQRVRDGKVRDIVIVWTGDDNIVRSSQCGAARFKMVGMLEAVKVGLLIEREGDEGE